MRDRQKEKEEQKERAKILFSRLKEKRIQKVRGDGAALDIGSRLSDVLGSVDKAQAVVREMITRKVQSPAPNHSDAPKESVENCNVNSSGDSKEDFYSKIDDENSRRSVHRADEKNIDDADKPDAELEVFYCKM